MIYKLIAVSAVALVSSVALLAAGQGGSQASARARISNPMRAHTGPLPALPRVSFDPPRSMAVVQQVYEFAAKHPEVLQYVPCYCGCERVGHSANHSCFVKARAANGRVTEWDSHGIGCAVCIDVARDAMTLFNSGSRPAAIREAIDKKYAASFPSSTPTPRPSR
jgi:hypothetical protein